MPQIGPTGINPAPINATDRGGLLAVLQPVGTTRAFRYDFGTELTWVSVAPPAALIIARAFRRVVRARHGDIQYDVSMFPFRVVADRDNNVVVTHFGQKFTVLVARPEVFLAWADRLAEVALAMVDA